jgi:hypothetical protein
MNKLQIIETSDYILAVSNEKIKENCWYENNNVLFLSDSIFDESNNPNQNKNNKLVIAYQPKGNTLELDLPLLPEIVEDEVEDNPKIHDWVQEVILEEGKTWNDQDALEPVYYGIVKGYKAATKVYSEDDLRKAIMQAFLSGVERIEDYSEVESDILQPLKQPKTPKWFVAEMEEWLDQTHSEHGCYRQKLKTTTINGKTYLVGTYLYE